MMEIRARKRNYSDIYAIVREADTTQEGKTLAIGLVEVE